MKTNKFLIPVVASVFILGMILGTAFDSGGTAAAMNSPVSSANQVFRSKNFTFEGKIREPQNTLTDIVSSSIPIQGRLITASGVPLNGDYNLIFNLYETAVAGTTICTDMHWVTVTQGLFSTTMEGCNAHEIYGKQLYLGIQVSGDVEMSPRQPIYPVPYALSLVPGAIINNTVSGKGLEVISNNPGYLGTALWVENTNTAPGGIGVWSVVEGEDASIIASNNGSGQLFKGFGSDGGEDEFRVNNDGAIETKADSYIYISGSSIVKWDSNDTIRLVMEPNGAVSISPGSLTGFKNLAVPITIPAVWYGQPVKVKNITIYYICSNGTKAYIDQTYLWKQTSATEFLTLVSDTTHRTSSTTSSYELPVYTDNILSADQGGLMLALVLYFPDDTEWITIGSIRIQLGHHDLY